MLYLIAILFPPLAVLLAGKPIQAVLNLVLTLFFYVPGLIHAILVVHDKKADKRMKQQAAFIAKLKRTTK
ncbi:YqaE/Pmp3 family membrane protein [Peribacillus frigoritolerans]|uniref:YqaE/Pmp3 family membrane protein n=1 Tax=Peribacillus TaxID=2675229 RepID=UPI000D0332F5|nr:YqaE/Pmp3 family membrane protein [Peribacillus frigoritolerans]PRS42830.1 YqaE/Pmp3 family membrane protein [Bacillus sp. RJGP41]QNK51372.1 YqaE/Pmp3 family membrane protein [Brevibacterium sp. PAMC23299]MCK2017978.1 YqaE/Pmp3 family membrane protein [Peribacillus frigoritolerans]MCU6599313.1 YqaE/Pmp3 family membrane protein [Peribacillus frigoritolerans]MCY8940208.1 YqaE/Pmp3 family membrane protein [Peribacillus frigoritolerans]